jgi:hypothetical protein
MARRAGAELVVTGAVQKISNLIPNMNIYIRDATDGHLVTQMSDWLARNRMPAGGSGAEP